LNPGDLLDRYVIEKVIGRGGMSTVYRARHERLRSLHAIKVLQINVPAVRRRLLLEGRVQASLKHPNIVAVTDVIERGDNLALVMEYVNGPALYELLTEPLSVDEALRLFRGMVTGVAAAHAAGLVHRDLKPANVLLSRTNMGFVPKVGDFGLVKVEDEDGMTRTGAMMGTPSYMSPEQIRAPSDVDHRSDLWSLGVILYEMLAARPPFKGVDPLDTFNRIAHRDFPPLRSLRPDVPKRVTDVIDALLVPDRNKRLQSTDEILAILYSEDAMTRSIGDNPKEFRRSLFTPESAPQRDGLVPIEPTRFADEPSPEPASETWRPAKTAQPPAFAEPRTHRRTPRLQAAVVSAIAVGGMLSLLLALAALAVIASLPAPGPVPAALDVRFDGVPDGFRVHARLGDETATSDASGRVILHPTGDLPRVDGRAPKVRAELVWAVGEACGAPACLPTCGSGCATGTAVVDVPFLDNPFGVVVELPDLRRAVSIRADRTLSAAAIGGIVGAVDGDVARFSLVPPGEHDARLDVGSCPAESANCSATSSCPAGCASIVQTLQVDPGPGALHVEWMVPEPARPGATGPGTSPPPTDETTPPPQTALVTGAAFAAWLADHPEWSRDEAIASGRANRRYLKDWAPDAPAGPITAVTYTAAAAFCAPRGGLLGLDDAPQTWTADPRVEWRVLAGRPAKRRSNGQTTTREPTDEVDVDAGFRCAR
jgi:serine/threonine protein kinase